MSFTLSVLFVSLWVAHTLSCSDTTNYPLDFGPQLCKSGMPKFDYIVAGAGSAGCVVASRLSENPTFNILLLERGNDSFIPSVEIPLLWTNNVKSDLDYQYLSEPQTFMFQGLTGGLSPIAKGKVSGGSSSINGALYTRGYPRDYDVWKEMGCDGWDYKSVLPYFLKSEDYRGNFTNTSALHGTGGPLSVSPFISVDPAVRIFSNGFEEMGLPKMDDLNGPSDMGYGYLDGTTRNGKRCSTFKAFLSNTRYRANLFYARNSTVNRVIFDAYNTAIGVEVLSPSGTTCTVLANNEVILSLGAVATPQILLLSGVGPKNHLTKLGIPVVANLPVGVNYQDHIVFWGITFSDRKYRPPEQIKEESEQLTNATMDLVERNISTNGLLKPLAYFNTKHMDPRLHNIQFTTIRIPYKSMRKTHNKLPILTNLFGFSEETAQLFTDYNNKADSIFIIVALTDVLSTGRIELKTLSATDHPKISLDFLSDEREIESLLAAVRFIEHLNRTEALRNAGIVLEHINYKACRKCPKSSDQYWKCAFRQIATGFYHAGGSVRMGALGDAKAVLDPRLRVKGVCNLRVADASIMPKIVSTNTNAGTIMIGEKTAHMIMVDSKKPKLCNFKVSPNQSGVISELNVNFPK